MKLILFYDKQPRKFLKKLNTYQITRIIEKIDLLRNDPVPHDSKSVVGEHNVFRIKIGDIRVLYRLDYKNRQIVIFNIDNREKVYN